MFTFEIDSSRRSMNSFMTIYYDVIWIIFRFFQGHGLYDFFN